MIFDEIKNINVKGSIKINNYDIKDIPLKKLRRSLYIVPQEPF